MIASIRRRFNMTSADDAYAPGTTQFGLCLVKDQGTFLCGCLNRIPGATEHPVESVNTAATRADVGGVYVVHAFLQQNPMEKSDLLRSRRQLLAATHHFLFRAVSWLSHTEQKTSFTFIVCSNLGMPLDCLIFRARLISIVSWTL
jgi:hypothetical protein